VEKHSSFARRKASDAGNTSASERLKAGDEEAESRAGKAASSLANPKRKRGSATFRLLQRAEADEANHISDGEAA
jgi:hypothetical protein